MWREQMQWKENTTAGSRMSTGRSAYGIRTTLSMPPHTHNCDVNLLF